MIEDRSRDYMNARRVAKVQCLIHCTAILFNLNKHDYLFETFSAAEGYLNGTLLKNLPYNEFPFPSTKAVIVQGFFSAGIRDSNERSRPQCSLCSTTKYPSGSSAGRHVEEIHTVGKEQSLTHRRPNPHNKKR